MNSSAKVDVCMVTYNHDAFIAQAIESVLSQKTSFKVRLIIGEDCSTDDTRAIVLDYEKRYPSQIKVITSAENVGMMKNFLRILSMCDADYVALLDGDDYWIDSKKLQMQVDFMEKNADFSICFHKVTLINDENIVVADSWPIEKIDVATIEDLAKVDFIASASCLFRNRLKGVMPSWFSQSSFGDYPLHLLNAKYGKIKCIPISMAVYRLHRNSNWHAASEIFQLTKSFLSLDLIKKEFDGKVLFNLQIQQYLMLEKMFKIFNDEQKKEFIIANYGSVIDLMENSISTIYNEHIALQSKGARYGMKIAEKLKLVLNKK